MTGRPVNWTDVRRMHDVHPEWGCADIAAELARRGLVTDYEHGMTHFVRCTFYHLGWRNPKGKAAPGRATWRDVAAMRAGHPDWSCARIAAALQDEGLSTERKHMGAWVRSVFQRHGWANPGSYYPALRNMAKRQALELSPTLRLIHERAIAAVGHPALDREPEPQAPESYVSEKAITRAERRRQILQHGSLD